MKQIRFEDGTFDIRDMRADGGDWRAGLESERARLRGLLDARQYERKDLHWYQASFLQYFLFLYDSEAYDRAAGRWRIEEIIDQGIEDFGGYDHILLWHSYPRLGIDERNQFDFFRDMPGGLAGLRDLVDRAHARGVRVFIPYMPWDTGTRRDPLPDHELLARVVRDLDVDGVCLDTMNAARPELREAIDKSRAGVVFSPEYFPLSAEMAAITTGSDVPTDKRLNRLPTNGWEVNWIRVSELPQQVLTIKWVEPRYSARGNLGHYPVYQYLSPLLTNNFFHGTGHQIGQNLFGWHVPLAVDARHTIRKSIALLRAHRDAFLDRDWQPYVDTLVEGVFAHQWRVGQKRLYTLFNNSNETTRGPVIRIPLQPGERVYDAWDGIEPTVRREASGAADVSLTLEPLACGCLVVQPASWPAPFVAAMDPPLDEERFHQGGAELHQPVVPTPSAPWTGGALPAGMVEVPGARYRMRVGDGLCSPEGGCYSYPDRHGHPDRLVAIEAFLMDRTEVTNAQYREFLRTTGYTPHVLVHFLRHWSKPAAGQAGGNDPRAWRVPEGKENHPVVYVDLGDARAYARWAGKRLPTEEEWQYASQGLDGRQWPWGNTFDAGRVNGPDGTQGPIAKPPSSSGQTSPVDAHPDGASPFGCLDMSGNVWEWTESERDDGHTRYAILRGGSYFRAGGTRWYTAGGAQPCDRHQRMILLYPGLDRCATIGFRCVKDKIGAAR